MWPLPTLERLRTFIHPKRFAILEACLIGLVSGLAAVCLQEGIGWIGGWRISLAARYSALRVLPLVGFIGGGLAGILIENIAPEADGSGIPQVKAVLAQFPMALDLRVALVKLGSGIAALGAGLSLGRQGPTVQLGAALAAQLSYWVPTAPDQRRQMIAAGAGAGLAAGFNAPIAGVLFIVEELLHDLSGVTLGTAILSSFIGALVARVLGGQSLYLQFNQVSNQTGFSVTEIPFFIVLGVLAGGLGALFNRILLISVDLKGWLPNIGLPWRMGLAGSLCGFVISLLPEVFQDNTGLRGILGTGTIGWQLAALAFVVQFGLTVVTYGSGAPGGLFAPSLILGAALGNLVGLWETSWLGDGLTPTYALVGMGAFFGAVSRVPVTGIVIIFEITRDFNLVLPLMISSVVAYLIAGQMHQGSVYDQLLRRRGIQLQEDSTVNQDRLAMLTADDIMVRQVQTLAHDLSLEQAKKIFAQSHHRGFPVLEQGRLVGIISQTDFTSDAKQRQTDATVVADLMTPHPVTVSPTATLTEVLYLLNRSKISRLPVTEGRKLVGIITRADIIRAESDQVSGEHTHHGLIDPSYVVYQTQGPAIGAGRLLVPLEDSVNVDVLMQLAIAVARDRNYELELLHVIVLPRNQILSETPVQTTTGRRLLRRAATVAQQQQIPIHTQIRVAHDAAAAILETEKQRHIDLLLMGWQGTQLSAGQQASPVVTRVLQQSASDVLVIKPSLSGLPIQYWQRWLLPVAESPHAEQAMRLIPTLTMLSQTPEIRLCHVYSPNEEHQSYTPLLNRYVAFLAPRIRGYTKVTQLCAQSVPEAIVDLATLEQFDVIVLGASQNQRWKQVIMGTIADAIATHTDRTVIIVRSHQLE